MTLPRDMLLESLMRLMGCYYVFQLTYSKCIARLLSIIQTEVLKDFIHESQQQRRQHIKRCLLTVKYSSKPSLSLPLSSLTSLCMSLFCMSHTLHTPLSLYVCRSGQHTVTQRPMYFQLHLSMIC